jgi:hypothetical protein
MRARTPSLVALALALGALAAWRMACIDAGPDVDTDAYAHHVIARAILQDPRDLAVHWVWLPLFHYAQVPLVALGGTMLEVRWFNGVLAAVVPLVLFAYVERTAKPGAARTAPEATALLAALFAAASPIAMQMGTTAQPEPLFALLVLGLAIAFERRRYVTASLLLGAAVMLRYEAWAALAAIGAVAAWETVQRVRRRTPGTSRESLFIWMVVAFPAALILGWAVLRRPVDGKWFGFVGQTHEFATDAQKGVLGRGIRALVEDALYYPLVVPVRVLGPAMALAPFGVVRTLRQQGPRFALVFLACLGFVALSWITRSSLKLDRHFVCAVPLYATFAAQGAAAVADAVAGAVARIGRRSAPSAGGPALAGRAAGGTLAVLALAGLAIELTIWMEHWRGAIATGFPERVALGAYVRGLPGGATIFCDDATLEIPTGLDRRRFDRHWSEDPQTWELVRASARAHGVAYVATWRQRLRGHSEGEVVFQAGFDPNAPDTTGVAVMRVPADVAPPQR